MIKKHVTLLKLLVVIAAALTLSLPGSVMAESYKLKLGHLLPEALPCGKAATDFAKIVEEKTGGDVKIKNYFSQQLGPWQEEFDMVSRGTLDMGFLAASPRYDSLRPLSAIWIVTSWDQFKKLYFKGGEFYNYTAEAMDKLGIKLLSPFCIDFEGIGGTRGPVVKPSDVTDLGLKVRTMGGLSMLFWEDLGPAVKIDTAELFTALQLGTVDSMADLGALSIYGGFKEITKYYTELNAFPGFGTFIMNKKLWEKMDQKTQTIIMDAAVEVSERCTNESQAQIEAITNMLEDGGTKVTRLTPEQKELWYAEAMKPGGYMDKLRKAIGDEMTDFMINAAAEASK